MAAPCQVNTVQFRRKLQNADREILLAAGGGDITVGFHRVMGLYRRAHEQGIRPTDSLDSIVVYVSHGGVNE
jgi:hypothetical protein